MGSIFDILGPVMVGPSSSIQRELPGSVIRPGSSLVNL